MEDRNCLSFWYPKIKAEGLPTPRTTILRCPFDLTSLLDGRGYDPQAFKTFTEQMGSMALRSHGFPCFLRTGHGSGKHEWHNTCFLERSSDIPQHIYNLVEWSHLVDIGGLPHEVWVLRDLIPTEVLFRCDRYGGMPVTREVRVFARDGQPEHFQPYWPEDAAQEGQPDRTGWRDVLRHASQIDKPLRAFLGGFAGSASAAVGGGYWSVDFLQDREERWWLIDMADGDRSFRYDP